MEQEKEFSQKYCVKCNKTIMHSKDMCSICSNISKPYQHCEDEIIREANRKLWKIGRPTIAPIDLGDGILKIRRNKEDGTRN